MNLAQYLLVAGLVIFAGVYFYQRLADRAWSTRPQSPPVPVNLASTTDAIILASGYGRITFANEHARRWFNLDGVDPNLELLAENARPADALRDLFAAEGRAMLQIGQRRVEASSHFLPVGGEGARHMVVILRDLAAVPTAYGPDTTRTLVMLSQIGEHISATNPLPDTLHAILDSLRTVIAYDAAQVLLWDGETETLQVRAQHGVTHLLSTLAREAEKATSGEGPVGWVTAYGEPLLVEHAAQGTATGGGQAASSVFESYAGVPLTIGDAFLGVLHIASQQPKAFDFEDLVLLGTVGNQVSAAVDRARQFEEKVQRANELAGVQAIVRAAAEASNRRELFNTLARSIAAAQDVEICGLLLYDPDSERLIPQPSFVGIPDAVLNLLDFQLTEGSLARRIWLRDEGWYANQLREENLIDSIGLRDYLDVLSLRALALMPLVISRRRIGAILLGNPRGGRFTAQDMGQLQVLAAQSAVVVESIRLADRDRYHNQEFESLQAFSLHAGKLADEDALYQQAGERLAALLQAEMAGIMLYDPVGHALEAHPSFYGIDPGLLEYVQIPVPPRSALEKLWQEEHWWICNDLARDPVAVESGLSELTRWVGITQVLLVPLLARGQAIGAVLVSNRADKSGFTVADARLVTIFAAQIAVIRENARLLAEVDAHVSESRTLRQIAAALTQRMPLNDLLAVTLRETADFFDSALALVQFLDEATGTLRVQPEYVHGAKLHAPVVADVYSQATEQSAVISGRPLLSNDFRAEVDQRPVYRPIALALGLQQVIIAPLQAGGERLGELIVANPRRGEFLAHDVDRLILIATQFSAALERLRLMQMTDEALKRRTEELTALDRVNTILSQTVELERIAQVIQYEAARVTEMEGCSILLLSPHEEWADVETPELMRRHGDLPGVEDRAAIEDAALHTAETIRVDDYAGSELAPAPEWAVCALAVPVRVDEKAIGVIHLYDRQPVPFDDQLVTFVEALAGKAAAAYMNAVQFREQISRNQLLSRRVEQLNQVFEVGQVFRAGRDLEDLLDAVAYAVQSTTGYAVVLISLYDEQQGVFRRVAQAGIPLAEFEKLRQVTLTREQLESALQDKFRVSQSYFLPAEYRAEWAAALHDDEIGHHHEYVADETFSQPWHPDDALIVPLRDSRGELLGIMSVDAPQDGRRPIRSTLEPLEVFAQQAAIGIENYRLLEAIQREADAARRERDVMERLYEVSSDIQRAGEVPERLQVVAQGIRSAGWRRVHITLRDADMEPTTLIAEGYSDEEADALTARLISGRDLRQWLADPEFFNLRLGTAFYLRHDAPWVVANLRNGQAVADPVPPDRWHPQDQVILPIYGTDTRLIGLIGMEEPVTGAAPTEASMRPIALFANQAAAAIETTRLYQETRRAAEQEALFNEMMQAVTSTLDPVRIVQALVDGVQRFLPFTQLTVAQYNPESGQFDTLQAGFVSIDRVDVAPGPSRATQDTLLGEVFRQGVGQVHYFGEEPPDTPYQDVQDWWQAGERTVMLVPMMVGGGVVGVIHLGSELSRAYGFDDPTMQLVQRVANLSSVALENARLYADARYRAAELTAQAERLSLLNRVSTQLAQSLDAENILDVALQESVRAMGVTRAQALTVDAEAQTARVIVDFPRGDEPPAAVLPFESPVLQELRKTLKPLIIEDVAGDPLLDDDTRALFAGRQVSALVMIPLVVGRQVIGLLALEAEEGPHDFSPDRLELVGTIAGQAAIAVQNANLLEQSYIRTRELETLFEASQATAMSLDLDQVMESVAEQMIHALGADASSVLLWDEVEQTLVVYADVNPGGQTVSAGTTYDLSAYPLRQQALLDHQIVSLRLDQMDAPEEVAEMQALGSQARMLIPLVVRDRAIGLIRVDLRAEYRGFSVSEQRIARTLAGQAAISIENARLTAESAAQVQEAFIISDLSRAVSAAVDMRELLPLVRTQVLALTNSDGLFLAVYDREQNELSFPVAMLGGEDFRIESRPLSDDEFSWIIRNRRPLLLLGEELVAVRRNFKIESFLPPVASFLGVPMDIGTEAVGVLAIADRTRDRAFGVNDQRILTTIASQLAIAVQNARLFSELRRFNMELERRIMAATEEVRAERDRLNVLYNITAELSASLDLGRVLNRALELLSQAVGAEQGVVLLVDPARERLYKRAALGEEISGPGLEGGMRLDEGLAGWVISNRQSVVVADVHEDSRWLAVAPEDETARAAIAALLETSEDVLGVLLLFSTTPGKFDDDHLRLVTAAANQLATSVNNAELYTFIREQAEQLGDMVREKQVEATKSNAILEGVADGVIFVDANGAITLFNSAAERVLGIPRADVIGQSVDRLTGLFTRGGKRWSETVAEWLANPDAARAGDYFTETAELGERIVNLTLAPVTINDQFLGAVSVLRDITREVEVDRMKTEFISNVSHELRTPMTSIKGYTDLLVMGAAGEINDQQRAFLTTIKANADRLGTLVNDLLNISRIDSGKAEMNYRALNPGVVLLGVVKAIEGQMKAEGKSLELVVDVDDDLPETYADQEKLTQIFANLLENAYQYTPDGGKITVSAHVDGPDHYVIAVSDTGIGIPEKLLPRIFERFFRNDEHPIVMETPGTGLGLALVKELVEMHRGDISVESRENVGTTFTVVLPIISEPPAEAVPQTRAQTS
ncbi:MAG: GAF domain-containing protein [Anaerolineae bacterium]